MLEFVRTFLKEDISSYNPYILSENITPNEHESTEEFIQKLRNVIKSQKELIEKLCEKIKKSKVRLQRLKYPRLLNALF